MSNQSTQSRRGFTLVELLVVIAIIGILVGMLFPAIQAVREAARRTSCKNNIRQLGLAMHNYESARQHFPPGWDTLGWTWATHALPYIEQQNLYDTLDRSEIFLGNWDFAGGPNTLAAAAHINPLRCPSSPVPKNVTFNAIPDRAPTEYRGNAGRLATSDDTSTMVSGTKSLEMLDLDGIFHGCSKIRFKDVTDGMSHTVVVAESLTDPDFSKDGQAMDHWGIGSPQIDPCQCDGGTGGTEFSEVVGTGYFRMNLRLREPASTGYAMEMSFGAYHPGGMHICLGDGSTHFIDENMDLEAYGALFSRKGAEITTEF
jgi:prepilin-type N-terminal cleavage/methylation domain-containing protein